jgi:hypothetical protein
MMLCMNACNAQWSGRDYAPDTPMLGRGKQSFLTAYRLSGVTRSISQSYEMDKLIATLRLSEITLSELLRISGSINSLIIMMICYVMLCNAI